MCLIISTLAAVFATLIWYTSAAARRFKVSLLCYLFWGASIMWFVDLVFEYAESGAEVFTPAAADVLNDTLLGLAILTASLVLWIAVLLIQDPDRVIRKQLAAKDR